MKKYFALGGRMTKWKGRVASLAPNLASVSVVALVASGAMATADVLNHATSYRWDVGSSVDLTITNSGHIIVDDSGTNASTVDVYLATYNTGTVENSGELSVTTTSGLGFTFGAGIETANYLGDTSGDAYDAGVITNAVGGAITVDLSDNTDYSPQYTSEDAYTMEGFGILVSGSMLADSQITNAGTITVTAHGSNLETVQVAGILSNLGSDDDAVISNSGTISVSGTGTAATVYATGIQEGYTSTYPSGSNDILALYGETAGDILNSGDISATATAFGVLEGPDAYAYATGIYATTMSNGSIDNTSTGDLTVRATLHGTDGTSGFALAHGIWVEGIVDDTSTISTTGSIDVTAIGSDGGDAVAYGIEIGSSDGIYGGYDNTGIYNDGLGWHAQSGASVLDGTLTIGGDVTATAVVLSHRQKPTAALRWLMAFTLCMR